MNCNLVSIVEDFIPPERRGRLMVLLRRRDRSKFVMELLRRKTYRSHQMLQIPTAKQNLDDVLSALGGSGSDTLACVLSLGPWDGQFAPVQDALNASLGSAIPTLIVIPGRELAYLELEGMNERFLLRRVGSSTSDY